MNPLTLVLVVVLIVILVGGLPAVYPHSYGYWPSGLAGTVLLVLLVLILLKIL